MRIRLLTVAAAAGMVVAALPSHAATAPKPQISDPAGDANGINDQGTGIGAPPSAATGPADLAAADITAVTFQNTFTTKKVKKKTVKVPTGFTITMALSGSPTVPNIIYRVSATSSTCDSLFFEYSTATTSSPAGSARCAASLPNPSGPVNITSAVIKGSSIIWTVPISSVKQGAVLSKLDASTRFISGTPGVSVTAPQFDDATTSATFTVGK